MDRITERLNYYNSMLARKQSLVKPIHDKQNKFEELTNKEYVNMMTLEAEIRLITEFIEDIKYITE